MRLAKLLCAAVAASLLAGPVLAEGFPNRSFDDLAALDLRLIQEQKKKPEAGDLFFNPSPDDGGRAMASYTGRSRPIDLRKQAFIIAFASSGAGNQDYARLYQREYLFQAGGKDYWLPVQGQVSSYFARELKPGQPVALYIRNAGGFRNAQAWDWVFLVEEFDSANTPKGAPPPARKGPVIPPGPKTAV